MMSGYNQDPYKNPLDFTVQLKRSGPQTRFGASTGPGSGGEAFIIYNWKAGNVYSLLTRAIPAQDATIYTSWFKDSSNASNSNWRLIAEWSRPKIQTLLKSMSSYIEGSDPNYGNLTRQALYYSQWYYDSSRMWKEVTTATFNKDVTGNYNRRRDSDGGIYTDQSTFFLQTGGFFNTTTMSRTQFTRRPRSIPPNINFGYLP